MATILVIDDEPIVLDLISTVLRLDGHDVQAISDPLAALLLIGRTQCFDLLLADVKMHPIGGFELARRAAESGFDIPILFITGYSGLSAVIRGASAKYDVLEKPFTASSLRRAVNTVLASAKTEALLHHIT